MEHGYKTKQRELILNFMKRNAHRCMTADEIINGISGDGRKASRATVYRCLERFTADGEISRFIGARGEGAVYRYSDTHSNHFHLKCTVCESTQCIDCGFINRMQEHFFEHHGFTVSKTQTVIYGLCSSCSAKREAVTH